MKKPPKSVRKALSARGTRTRFAPNPNLARAVRVGDRGPTVHVVPGSESVCLVISSAVSSCAPIDEARAGALYILRYHEPPPPPIMKDGVPIAARPSTGPQTLTGLAPDGYDTVTATMRDGTTITGRTRDGVYRIVIPGNDLATLTITGASGGLSLK